MPYTKCTLRGSDGHLERARSHVATPTRFVQVAGDSSMHPKNPEITDCTVIPDRAEMPLAK